MKTSPLSAVILVAGRGERLRPLTTNRPKPLVPVNGRPILGHTLDVLKGAGLSSAVLVTGYRASAIENYVGSQFTGMKVRFVRNDVYAATNTLYSLWAARKLVKGRSFLLMDGDLMVEPKVLEVVLRAGEGNFLACDARAALDSEAVKAWGRPDGRILGIGKTVEEDGTPLGESIGLAKINQHSSSRLFRTCGAILKQGGKKQYYEAAFQKMIDEGTVFWGVDIGGAKWVEIDTKADLKRARVLFTESVKPAA